jgi:hypothetical protein
VIISCDTSGTGTQSLDGAEKNDPIITANVIVGIRNKIAFPRSDLKFIVAYQLKKFGNHHILHSF